MLDEKLRGVDPATRRNVGLALEAMRPPPKLNVHEWAEARRVLPPGSPEPGLWRSKPYQRPVLEAIGKPGINGVVFVGASQGAGKTEILLNAMGYYADADPSTQLFVTSSVEMAEQLSKHRVAPMIAHSQALRGKIAEARSRDSGNTIRDKLYPGGELTMAGANSPGGLSMHPKRVALFDEIDRYAASAGTEGDPVALAETRTSAYWNAVLVYSSSPGTRETSRLWKLWQESDQNEWSVPCGACKRDQVLKWGQVQWEKDDEGEARPETAFYACEHCGAHWGDVERWRASERGRFVPQAEFHGMAGFRVSGLVVLGKRLEAIVKRWVRAQGSPEQLKVFINTVLAEWWDETHYAKVIDETGLLARREEMPERGGLILIPRPAAIVTAGVDVQDDRFEISLWAWGAGFESWVIEHAKLFGDPSNAALWEDLDRWLLRPLPRADGGYDFVRGACVDTGGHHTQAAYDFCGPRFRRVTPDGGRMFIFAVKGFAGSGEVWPRKHSAVTAKVPLWPIRVDPAKEHVYGRLSIAEPGPGYIHFPTTLGREFFEGITAEKIVTEVHKKTGLPRNVWKLQREGMRNEPLDCAAMAFAALCGLRANGFDLDDEVARLRARPVYEPKVAEASSRPVPSPEVAAVEARRVPVANEWLGDVRGWLGR